mmetsp:Transcript_29822/g.72720  ORF Transcript_29822/g.72720 Transcript_29822/m.72720 type:complete len:98 (-) Transcript_29822:72-365(-)
MKKNRVKHNVKMIYLCNLRPMTIPEHEDKIIDILQYTWEFHRFCLKNNIEFHLDEAPNQLEIAREIARTGILPDGRPVGWENDKKYWDEVMRDMEKW